MLLEILYIACVRVVNQQYLSSEQASTLCFCAKHLTACIYKLTFILFTLKLVSYADLVFSHYKITVFVCCFLRFQASLQFSEYSEVMKRWADHLCGPHANQKVGLCLSRSQTA